VGIPIDDDEPLEPTDDERVTPAGLRPDEGYDEGSPDEVSPADAADQRHEVSPGWRIGRRSRDPEVSEADALDQAMRPPADDEDEA
jgi:hypothetical protein